MISDKEQPLPRGELDDSSETRPGDMTDGEYRVGVTFNPSGNPAVDGVKVRTAMLIDDMLNIVASSKRGGMPSEAGRCAALAATAFEEAAMWAVKALTKPAR